MLYVLASVRGDFVTSIKFSYTSLAGIELPQHYYFVVLGGFIVLFRIYIF